MSLIDILSGIGTMLDTPGALTRGVLAGKPGSRVGGRDLLERWGFLGPNQEGLDWGDVGGFGAEMLLDPLNLVGAGLWKSAARLAAKRFPYKVFAKSGAGVDELTQALAGQRRITPELRSMDNAILGNLRQSRHSIAQLNTLKKHLRGLSEGGMSQWPPGWADEVIDSGNALEESIPQLDWARRGMESSRNTLVEQLYGDMLNQSRVATNAQRARRAAQLRGLGYAFPAAGLTGRGLAKTFPME